MIRVREIRMIDPGYGFIFPLGYLYIRIKKDGSIWRRRNPMYYKPEEINSNITIITDE